MKLLDIFLYSIIMAVLITMVYTLLLIAQFKTVNLTENNKMILMTEIFLVGLGISLTGYKIIDSLKKV